MAQRIDSAKHAWWQEIVEQWKASGLSLRGFCAREKIGRSHLFWWKQRLTGKAKTASVKPEPAFVPVTIIDPPAATGAGIDIHLASGHHLRVRGDCDGRLLAEVIALLEGRSC